MNAFRRLLLICLALVAFPVIAAPTTATLQEGVDYDVIDVGPFDPLNGKIEVVEVFGYTCGHCARFESVLQPWKKKLPADVRFTPVPAAFGGFWDPWALTYLASKQTGVAKESHQAVFDAIHKQRSLPASGITPAQLGTFFSRYGVSATDYEAALRSDSVQREFQRVRQYAIKAEVAGTPTLIVNGKYRVNGNTHEDALRITDALIKRERAAQKKG